MEKALATIFDVTFSIADQIVGKGNPCFVIAEAGVSHFGSMDKALALVDAAVNANADAVKFQIFRTSELISSIDQEWTERMRPKELSFEAFRDIRDYCRERGIIFFATAHDLKSLEVLVRLDPPSYKVGSGEVKNPDYFKAVAQLGKPVIFSTGMYSREDFDKSLEALAAGGCTKVAVMHCVTCYPTPPEQVNLRRIISLRNIFPGPVGYSDHCSNHDIAAASVLLGADLIEKHITLEKNIPDAQDWKVACNPRELVDFVGSVRRLEAALGDGKLRPSEGEWESIKWARKSLVAASDLPAGAVLTIKNILFKRPGIGISPDRIDDVVGKTLLRPVQKDGLILFDNLT